MGNVGNKTRLTRGNVNMHKNSHVIPQEGRREGRREGVSEGRNERGKEGGREGGEREREGAKEVGRLEEGELKREKGKMGG